VGLVPGGGDAGALQGHRGDWAGDAAADDQGGAWLGHHLLPFVAGGEPAVELSKVSPSRSRFVMCWRCVA
jgi:hypothetical protein